MHVCGLVIDLLAQQNKYDRTMMLVHRALFFIPNIAVQLVTHCNDCEHLLLVQADLCDVIRLWHHTTPPPPSAAAECVAALPPVTSSPSATEYVAVKPPRPLQQLDVFDDHHSNTSQVVCVVPRAAPPVHSVLL